MKHLPNYFKYLNITQFLGAFNDTLYKWFMIYMMVQIQLKEHADEPLRVVLETTIGTASFLFALPFLFTSVYFGRMSDRFSKSKIILITKILEVIIMALGIVFFMTESIYFGYVILALMTTQSSMFSPAKFGIIPETVDRELISRANGQISMASNIAITSATAFAPMFITYFPNYLVAGICCTTIAIIGTLTALKIPYTEPKNKNASMKFSFFSGIKRGFNKAGEHRQIIPMITIYSFFFAVASFLQGSIVVVASDLLKLSIEDSTLYMNAPLAVGIGLGAVIIGFIPRNKDRLKLLTYSGALITACVATIAYLIVSSSDLIYFVIASLTCGVGAGAVIVIVDSYIQSYSPEKDKGSIIGSANFGSWVGIAIGAYAIRFFGDIGLQLSSTYSTVAVCLVILCMYCYKVVKREKRYD